MATPFMRMPDAPATVRPLSAISIFLVLGACMVPFSSLALPLPGGSTKPLIALFWIVPFVLVMARALLTLRVNAAEAVAFGMILLGAAWFPIVAYRGADADIAEYVVRLLSFAAAFSVLVVASNVEDAVTLRTLVTLLLSAYLFVLSYGLFVQVPGVVGVGPLYEFDVMLRTAILNRGLDIGRIQLMADEPSFAAYQAATAILLALIFRSMVSPRLTLLVILFGIVDLIFMKSVTALAMLMFVAAAWVMSLHDLRIRLMIGCGMVLIVGVAGSLVLSTSTSGSDPLARLADISTDRSANARFFLAKSTIDAGLDAGVMGLGPGQYSRVLLQYFESTPNVLESLPSNLRRHVESGSFEAKPFSLLGGVFAEFGLPAVVALVLLIVYPTWGAFRRRMPQSGAILVASSTIFVVWMGAVPIALPDMWLLLGLLIAGTRLPGGIPILFLPTVRRRGRLAARTDIRAHAAAAGSVSRS